MFRKQTLLILLFIFMIFTSCGTNAALSNLDSADQVAANETLPPTIVPTPTITPTPKPEYLLIPDFENFRDCYVPVEELLDGSYWNWLNEVIAPTLVDEFKEREDKIKYIKPTVAGIPHRGGGFIYRPNKLEYEDPEARPWKRDVTFASTSGMENGDTLKYMVLPVFYYDKTTSQVYPVVSVMPIRIDFTPSEIERIKKMYVETMNIPTIVFSQSPSGKFNKDNMVMNDSIVGKSYAALGPDEVWERTERFYNGDASAFSSPDMVVLATMSDSDAYK